LVVLGLNSGLSFAMQAFYHFSHVSSPLCMGYFSYIVSCFCLYLPQTAIPLPMPPAVAGITHVKHHVQLICWDGFSVTSPPPEAGLKPQFSWSLPPE
jgi:hypothetical protein